MCGNQEKAACNLSLTRQRGIGIREETNRITLPQIPRKSGSLPRKAVWRSLQGFAHTENHRFYRKIDSPYPPTLFQRHSTFRDFGKPSKKEEHKSERFAFGYVLYWLARSNKLQTGCSLRGRRFFRDFYFSETLARLRLRPMNHNPALVKDR